MLFEIVMHMGRIMNKVQGRGFGGGRAQSIVNPCATHICIKQLHVPE